jgi:hypothetical protein
MDYHVRLLTPSDKVIPFSEVKNQGKSICLVSGADARWERIEIRNVEDQLVCIFERHSVSPGSTGEGELNQLRDSIQSSYPVSAREWLRRYFPTVKTIYDFQLFGEKISRDEWPVLGRIQNMYKDLLTGIIQADNEGYYNGDGDYILWQMYRGATGTIQAATINEKGKWIPFRLDLTDAKAIERFKEGVLPKRGFLRRLFSHYST